MGIKQRLARLKAVLTGIREYFARVRIKLDLLASKPTSLFH